MTAKFEDLKGKAEYWLEIKNNHVVVRYYKEIPPPIEDLGKGGKVIAMLDNIGKINIIHPFGDDGSGTMVGNILSGKLLRVKSFQIRGGRPRNIDAWIHPL